jgi:hypothetical protein
VSRSFSGRMGGAPFFPYSRCGHFGRVECMTSDARHLPRCFDGDAPNLLSTGEFGRRLGRSREWALRQIRTGRVRALRTERGESLIPIAEVRRFLAE